jgi:DNA-binding response OmpR family regulator
MAIKVLVIDDDHATTDLLSQLLRSNGFDTVAATSGSDALEMTRSEAPGVVILNLIIPDIDVWELCRLIRTFSSVPILALSAIHDPNLIASILDAGADDYLVKPVSSSVLFAHLRKLVRRRGNIGIETQHLVRVARAGTQPLMP